MTVLSDLLARTANATPERTVFNDGNGARAYGELAGDASRMARALIECGVRRGDRVGVALEGGYETLVALYGIFDAGAVYVPLGETTAIDRLTAIAADCELVAIIDGRAADGQRTTSGLLPSIRHGARGKALLDREGMPDAMPWQEIARYDGSPSTRRTREGDLAYIFYTSGSTGPPKGVAHEHRSACAFARWAQLALVTDEDDRVAATSAITFDISLLELVAPVTRGAGIVGIPRRVAAFPGAFAKAVADARPTVLQLVPQLWRYLLGSPEALRHTRVGVVTGERMAPADWSALRAAAPGARLFNVYGSTELNDCAYFELPRDWSQSTSEVPIGRPVAGASVQLRGPDGALCAEEQIGELVVSSPMLMRGYWNLPAQTERRMIVDASGRRAFATGDLARCRADGMLELAGRRDRSVKLGGEWVHLDEVEAVVTQHPAIAEANASIDDAGQRPILCVVAVAREEIDPIEITRHCAARLPRPARPHRVELVCALPRNDRGKVELAKDEPHVSA